MSHFAVPLSMFCISVLNYILSCIKSVTFGHVPTVSTDGSPHTHQTFALLTPLSSTAQHSTQLHSSHRCKVERVLSVEWATAWPPWWCHKLQYFHPTRNPWLPGKIIKCVMTENAPINECITPRSCWTKPLNVPRKDGNSWQMGLELG